MQGQPARADSFLFSSFLPGGAGLRLRPNGRNARRTHEERTKNARRTHEEHYKTGLPAPLYNVYQGRHKIQARRKPGKNAAMTKASGGRPLRQERKGVSVCRQERRENGKA
nr:MAG TPA: hypothetical protein [Caudoviricetes sp.]